MTYVVRLPAPDHSAWAWQSRGACRGEPISLFFHPDAERGQAARRRDESAKEICGRCQVQAQCREFALRTREPYGIWGGMNPHERAALLRGAARAS